MMLVGGGWKCNNDDVQSFCVYKRALWKVRESTALSESSVLLHLSVLLFCVIKKKRKKHVWGKKYCILIVTWVLLRETNKYELETRYGKLYPVEIIHFLPSWDFCTYCRLFFHLLKLLNSEWLVMLKLFNVLIEEQNLHKEGKVFRILILKD